MVGSGLVALLVAVLGPDAVAAWAWRVPFVVAGPLGLIGLYIRLRLEDTPEFRAGNPVSPAAYLAATAVLALLAAVAFRDREHDR